MSTPFQPPGTQFPDDPEQFFAHLEGLSHDPTVAALARRFGPWLATGALAAGAVEFARRQRDRLAPRGPALTAH